MEHILTQGLFIGRRVFPSRRVTLLTEPPQTIELLKHFVYEYQRTVYMRKRKVGSGPGAPEALFI